MRSAEQRTFNTPSHSASGSSARPGQLVCASLIMALMLLVVEGCERQAPPATADSTSSRHTPTSTSTSPLSPSPTPLATMSTPPVQAAQMAAVTAYLGMWQDFAVAGRTSDWRSPLLAQHATAYALQVMSRSLYTDHQKGVVTKGAPVDHPRVKSVSPAADPTVVIVSDCGDSSHWLKYSVKTGKLVPGSPGGRQAITAEVRKQPDGSWKVDQFAVEGTGTC